MDKKNFLKNVAQELIKEIDKILKKTRGQFKKKIKRRGGIEIIIIIIILCTWTGNRIFAQNVFFFLNNLQAYFYTLHVDEFVRDFFSLPVKKTKSWI